MIGRACAPLVVLFVAIPMLGATPQEFYLNLLRRGVADFNAGRFDAAEEELRIAAFGLVEAIDSYQTAHIYLALAADRLGHTEDVRRAVGRVQAAQRVQARYAALPLPVEVRREFDALVQRVSPSAAATLRSEPGAVANPPASNASASSARPVVEREIAVQEIVVDPPRVVSTTTTTEVVAGEPGVGRTPTPHGGTTPTPAQNRTPTIDPGRVTTPAQNRTPATGPGSATTPTQSTTPAPQPSTMPTPRPSLAEAERALDVNDLPAARTIFRQHLDTSPDRPSLLRIAEGLYRARDFAGALLALRRLGELRPSERPYRYYVAVALYETGDSAGAKTELLAALPHIELTPDVESYRAKILGSAD
jgi:hypothetical protein